MPSPARTERRRATEAWGRHAETICAAWLGLSGWRVLERRYRTPHGEIDLIARRGRQIAFIEVKARTALNAGLHAVAPQQQARIAAAAALWQARHPHLAALEARFDLMVVVPWRLPRRFGAAWNAG